MPKFRSKITELINGVRSTGVQEFRSSGVQEFRRVRRSGGQEVGSQESGVGIRRRGSLEWH
jgi:hypothetical protein